MGAGIPLRRLFAVSAGDDAGRATDGADSLSALESGLSGERARVMRGLVLGAQTEPFGDARIAQSLGRQNGDQPLDPVRHA